ncbi:hypothetical protein NLX83_06465 [Allokutzneria sp. A3M-2-11 16]|uniref:hypothetical protein n=1 Tax=Allokutzneria sp. A3M-2-11 16 TaxID=2962043 RepID=UPI0020B877C0|nr:hypothetical protein [Allokutzneria sp. A3M-2-11 16]MCP3798897.1 hypothetical protein [Allokutzneria sp. A3M-2-11 16]
MSGGFRVDPDALVRCGTDIEGLRGKADDVLTKASEGDVAPISWGLLGQMTGLQTKYDLLAAEFELFARMAADGITHLNDRLRASAAAYRDSDANTGHALSRVEKDLFGGGS